MLLKIVSCTTLCYLAAAGSLVVLLVLLAVYFYIQHTMGICKSKKRMDGKTVIITGCTSGIGRETARDIAKRGARLIMACRNLEMADKLKGSFLIEKISLLPNDDYLKRIIGSIESLIKKKKRNCLRLINNEVEKVG